MNHTINYTPNSFGNSSVGDVVRPLSPLRASAPTDSNAFDLRYNFETDPPDINIMVPGGFNNVDIGRIDSRVQLGDDDPFGPLGRPAGLKLIDMGNKGLPAGFNNDRGSYAAYFDNKLINNAMRPPSPDDNAYASETFESTDGLNISYQHQNRFWLEDPFGLFRLDNYYKIIPTKYMSRIEILNALSRFFIYVLILFLLLGAKTEYVYIPVAGLIIIVVLFLFQKFVADPTDKQTNQTNQTNQTKLANQNPSSTEDFETDNITCQAPTAGNPFMNVTMADLMNNRARPPACNVGNPLIQKDMMNKFDHNVFIDVEDIFDRNHSSRQFYTMPATTIPNNQTEFAKWLYDAPPTCKENQMNCLKYEDIRFNRFNPHVDRMDKE